MESGTKRQIDISRLRADLAATAVEMLSAHCAADRVRLQYSPQDVAAFGDRRALDRSIASAQALHRFFSQVQAEINRTADANR